MRCEPTTRPCKPETLGFIGERFNVARQGIVGLIAMDINQEPALCRDLAKFFQACSTVRHGAFKMRDAADDIDAQIQGANEILLCGF